ncbi:MAG: peroxidase family protein [Burkholderiales bacterium]
MAHGENPNFTIYAPRARSYEGAYGRIFPEVRGWLPPGNSDDEREKYCLEFANGHMIEWHDPNHSGEIAHPREIANDLHGLRESLDREYNSEIPAGYTYFGQFIAHDITFDPTPLQMRRIDPSGLTDYRTPRLDLDNIYGRGPDDQLYLYDQETKRQSRKFLIGRVTGYNLRDLPRNSQGRALIGDPRNDENAIISQLHLAFLLAHNTLVDRAIELGMDEPFENARRTLRRLYQFIVWNDYIKLVTSEAVHKAALRLVPAGPDPARWELGLEYVYSWHREPFIPIEFSGAAYRFGHSMVGNQYQTNESIRTHHVFVPLFDGGGAGESDDLRGFVPIRAANVIQWDWFLQMNSSRGDLQFPQMARKIDTKLANALAFLAEDPHPKNVLAYRNLIRSCELDLPAGSATAAAVANKPSSDSLRFSPLSLNPGEPDSLWFYILREAELAPQNGNKLGPLGSLIVCATIAGLLKGDPSSYFFKNLEWAPGEDPLLKDRNYNIDGKGIEGRPGERSWTLASIIRLSGLPVDTDSFQAQQ